MQSLLETYDAAERVMRSRLSTPEVQAFDTTTFNRLGWPARVEAERDLVRYVDWCCHPGANLHFAPDAVLPTQCARLSFSAAERDLMQDLSRHTAALTKRLGREAHPLLVHLAQIGPFRILQEIKRRAGNSALNVFEIGGGSGYLSALLAMAGDKVATTDNAQGLYLWQSQLFRECFGARFADWLDGPPAADASIQLLPWWDYLGLRHACPIEADVVISNNNLAEMNANALAYTATLARRLLARSPIGLFIFTAVGTPMHNTIESVHATMQSHGFASLKTSPFWAYAPAGHKIQRDLLDWGAEVPVYRRSAHEKLVPARQVVLATAETLPVEMDFVSYIGVFRFV